MSGARAAAPLLAIALLLWVAAAGRDAFDDWVDGAEIPPLHAETSTEVLDASGTLLRAYTVEEGRWRMAPGAVDPLYLAMLRAWEDRRFEDHAGVDLRAAARAAAQAARHGRVVSGASTLSMQAARLLEDGPTGTASGKLRQIRIALAMERRFGKAAVMDAYLTRAPFGGNVEGVRAAAHAWLGRGPERLTPAQAALLVALPQAPESRRPDRHPQAARAARDRVLDRALALGVIDEGAHAAALIEPVPTARRPVPRLAPHLTDRAVAETAAARHVLTVDAALQASIEALAEEAARRAGRGIGAAILVADHRTGEIRASAGTGGTHLDGGWIDMTRALRSPGSTLKPLVYGMAMDAGLVHPETMIDDAPARFGGYAPGNFDGRFMGPMRVREALQLSRNLPVVALTARLGPAALVARMERAGMEPRIPGGEAGLAVALGGVGVTLEDLVTLYAGIARGGEAVALRHRPGPPEAGARILPETAAWHLGEVLSAIPSPYTGRVAWKTGTSYGHRDALAIGWDGRHVVGVWMGRPDGTPVPGAFGADLAAPVLFEAFGRLGRTHPLPAPPPGTLLGALPEPLRAFGGDDAHGPEIAFPPDGAVVERLGGALHVRAEGGAAPYVWLAEGAPVLRGNGAVDLPAGFVRLTVIDALGRADRVDVELR